jgi:hypothetical protein
MGELSMEEVNRVMREVRESQPLPVFGGADLMIIGKDFAK